MQHLNSGERGFAKFAKTHGRLDISKLNVDLFVRPQNFVVPNLGPMYEYKEVWFTQNGMYRRGHPVLRDSALSAIDRLAGYAHSNKRADFDRAVPMKFRNGLWKALSKATLVDDSHMYVSDFTKSFVINDDGPSVRFAKIHGKWTVVQFGNS